MSSEQPAVGVRAKLEAAGFHPIGSILVALGGLLVLCAFSVLNWFRSGTGFFGGAGVHSTFSDLHRLIEETARQVSVSGISAHVSFGVSRDYFGWLGWVTLAVVVLAGVLAVSQVGGEHFLARWLGAVVAAAGIGVTLLALNLITFEGNASNNANAPSYGDYLSHAGLGVWATIVGFLLVLVGSLVSGGGR
jgi:hypothetical protein